jgi:3-hydroxyisobutyrate dehydrogenase-like beta-hydroxyacid dehydrogenase
MRSTADTPFRSDVAQVGFIGLGDMGGAIATRIIGAGFPAVLWARRPEALGSFAGPRVSTRESPAELAAEVDLVGVCVWDDRSVREVLHGDHGVLAGCRPGTIIAIHSTVQPETCRELAATAAERGVIVLDAPVSGGRDAALAGQLVVAVGGDEAAVQRCLPVFASFGDPVLHLGQVGTAQFAKLINNSVLAANLALADDALALGLSLGIQPEMMAAVLRGGSGRSYALEVVLAARASAQTRRHALAPLSKDVRCLTSEAAPRECAGAELLTGAAAEAVRRLEHPPSGWAE